MRILLIAILALAPFKAIAQEAYNFNNPSFSGIGYSSHVLTLEQMTQNAEQKEKDRIQAEIDEALREEENSNLNRFINNFESRVYAQLSKKLVETLFSEDATSYGSFELAGNTVEYVNDGVDVSLTIIGPDGSTTSITIPIGSLGL
jgi:23S rRNA pseudoU1915 N3-methylase RlmH